MSITLELLAVVEVHGTPAGWAAGCRGSQCPSPVSCRDVHTRYAGDWSFAKRVDAGESPAAILAEEAAEADAVRARDKAATRAAKRDEARAHRDEVARKRRASTTAKAPRAPRVSPQTAALQAMIPDVTRLHGEGMNDRQIADELGVSLFRVRNVRREKLGLPTVARTRTPRPNEGVRVERRQRVVEAHGEGLTDQEIADRLGLSRRGAAQTRHRAGLAPNSRRRPAQEKAQREPRLPRITKPQRADEVAALHAEGLSDPQIAERLDIGVAYVGELRRSLNLPANRIFRSKWDGVELQGHGTNARYARGCRCEDCKEAKRAYHREYAARRRTVDAGAYHGTAYGYQLGCRGTACPEALSCTQAMLDQDRARRRAAGVQAKVLVDAAPVRAHVEGLHAAGMPYKQIAVAAGVPWHTVKALMFSRGEARPPVGQLLAERAALVLAVPFPEAEAA